MFIAAALVLLAIRAAFRRGWRYVLGGWPYCALFAMWALLFGFWTEAAVIGIPAAGVGLWRLDS